MSRGVQRTACGGFLPYRNSTTHRSGVKNQLSCALLPTALLFEPANVNVSAYIIMHHLLQSGLRLPKIFLNRPFALPLLFPSFCNPLTIYLFISPYHLTISDTRAYFIFLFI